MKNEVKSTQNEFKNIIVKVITKQYLASQLSGKYIDDNIFFETPKT